MYEEIDDERDEIGQEDEDPEHYEYCGCRFCTCMNRTEYGMTCNDCLNGAHQA